MKNNTFKNNEATVGGAIYIAFISSINFNFIWENTFINNKAEYGPNYASYASRLQIQNGLKKKVSSKIYYVDTYPGIKIPDYTISILDHFGQIISVSQQEL